MTTDPLLARLQALADDFSCRYWRCVAVLGPEDHEAKAQADYERNPTAATAKRREEAQGKYAVIFEGPAAPDWRGEIKGSRRLHATAAFSEDAKDASDDVIRLYFIGVILDLEIHEVLESSQVKSIPNVPIIDPHNEAQALHDLLSWVRDWMVSHALPRDSSAA